MLYEKLEITIKEIQNNKDTNNKIIFSNNKYNINTQFINNILKVNIKNESKETIFNFDLEKTFRSEILKETLKEIEKKLEESIKYLLVRPNKVYSANSLNKNALISSSTHIIDLKNRKYSTDKGETWGEYIESNTL